VPASPAILIATGEPSGDRHAALIVPALRELGPALAVEALGGPALAASGAAMRFNTTDRAVMGVVEILTSLSRHARWLRELDRDFRQGRYGLLLAVDYPGFNLRLAERARRRGVPVLYYIPPKHWATGSRLTPRLARAVDRVACTLPFEPDFFRPFGIAAEYVGHPLLDRRNLPDRSAARRALGLRADQRVLALFPGSRRQEIRRLWLPFREAGAALLQEGACDRVLVAGMPGGHYPDPGRLEVVEDRPAEVMASANGAIVKSGTATLEAALANVPMVVAYRMHPLTAWLARRVVSVPWVSLVNLIANRQVVPELLQEEMTANRLVEAARPLLDPDHPAAVEQRKGFEEVRTRLGGAGASRRVARIAWELLKGQ
jgi:lipid-A-disaccharide synthase